MSYESIYTLEVKINDQVLLGPKSKSAEILIPRTADPKFSISLSSSLLNVNLEEQHEEETEREPKTKLTQLAFHRIDSIWDEELDDINVKIEDESQKEDIAEAEDETSPFLRELQLGIDLSLQQFRIPDRDLLITDFTVVDRLHFSLLCPEKEESRFILHVYAPVAFKFFRDLFGITTEDFLNSICRAPLHLNECNGSSGSTFYVTHDDRFILKTVPKQEVNFLMNLFPGYFLNLAQHTKTLLPKFYGLYRYEKYTRTTRFLIMNNILPRIYKFYEKYDIKGSTYSRRKYSGKAPLKKELTTKITLKDLDFMERWPEGFYLNRNNYDSLIKSIKRDCKVLQSYKIMDYSLLLGIVIPDDPNASAEESNSTASCVREKDRIKRNKNLIGPFEARTKTGDTVYLFIGIIDILQSYTCQRKIEFCLKSLIYDSKTINVIRPSVYSQRFQKFLKDYVLKRIPELLPPSCKRDCCLEIEIH